MNKINLSVELGKLKLKNPVIVSAGCFGFGREYKEYYDLSLLGAMVSKGITLEPRAGNPPPRIAETPAGILNSIGLQNPGVEAFLKEELPFMKEQGTDVIVNMSGTTIEDYCKLAERLDRVDGIDALEVNISCPNVKKGGMAFGTDPESAFSVIKGVRERTSLPVIAKLSPNVTDIKEIAEAVEDAGADIVSLINTLLGMAIDVNTRRPILKNTFGGLSGPAVKPAALRMVWQVYQTVSIPIIGMGGITTWQDAVEFILAGATAVSIGTANFVNPLAPIEVIKGIEDYLYREKINDISDLIGLAHDSLAHLLE